jgi:glutamyl-tRNA synthetase
MTNGRIRVRYAPSPTGHPHVGNIRTALFNWLFARHNDGSFIVRIEDTDTARSVDGAVETIQGGLKWLGLDWDEGPDVGGDYGPYYQSERLKIYDEAANRLVAQGDAYPCYCSPQRLNEMRQEQVSQKQPPGYDRSCRNLSTEERAECETEGMKAIVRFKFPLEGETEFNDLIRERVKFENALIDDFVLLKSDGYPTYHLASVVDDHLMQISHVLRAEEWLSSTPRHLKLYKALGYEPPLFAHLPMLLGGDHSKLSKRHGAVSITEYREQGYLPAAMINFLSLLGWSLDDKTEILSQKDLVNSFTLERVNKTAAIFNTEKLDWMNGVYIRALRPNDFRWLALPFLEKGLPPQVKRPLSKEYVGKILPLVQDRARTLADIPDLTDFFFTSSLEYKLELLIGKKMDNESTLKALQASRQRLEAASGFSEDALEAVLRPLAEELGLKAGQLFGIIRVAITGRTAAPPLFQTMAVLGREKCLRRLAEAAARLHQMTK